MGQFVIAAYRPRSGKEDALRRILKDHLPILRREGLATDRPPYLMRASDGTFVEVFEWKSAKAVEDAHHNANVLKMWARFEEACEYVSLTSLEETKGPFPNFDAVDL